MQTYKKHRGFTIVELLIVTVVIAVLAAITIIAFNGVSDRARTSQAMSALSQAKKKLEVYKVENTAYPTTGNLASAGVTNSSSTFYQYTSTGATFCLTASVGGKSFNTTDSGTPTSGACSGDVDGGLITNLSTNPAVRSSASGWGGWAGGGGGVATNAYTSVPWSLSGRAARVTWTTGNTAYNGDIGYQFASNGASGYLEPNTQYTATWRINTSKSQRMYATVGVFSTQGGAGGTGTGTVQATSGAVITTPGTPSQQSVTFTTGANTVSAKVYSALVSGTGASLWNAGDWAEASELMIVKGGTAYSYADGNTNSWQWTGAADNSTSTGPPV